MQRVFLTVNHEEGPQTSEHELNDDHQMLRFEFLEGLIRAAIGK